MAVSSRSGEESERLRKMSLSYVKDSIVRKSGRQNGPRTHVSCCETEDANGERASTEMTCSEKDMSADRSNDMCKCTGKPLADKHKLGIFKSLKKRFQLKTNIGVRPMNCKSKHTFKSVESSSNCSVTLGEDAAVEGFTSANSRNSKGGSRTVCPVPRPLRFVRTTVGSSNVSSVSVSSVHERKEEQSAVQKVPDVVQNTCRFLSMPAQMKTNRTTNSNMIALPALRRSVDSAKEFPRRLSGAESDGQDKESSDYSEAHNFGLNVDEDGIVQYEPCDIVRHTIGEDSETMTSPTSRSLTCELLKLAKYGWYWGPISREEAEEKLLDLPDGAFLVRDSSADRYLLSVSFRSSGKTFHTRIEHSCGQFSFYTTPGGEGFSSIVELINHCMSYSESAVFCYSRPRAPGYPAFPVRLARPVSRFTQVRSLQYLCRFVIRQYTRVDNIQKLPLPSKLKGYIQEGHY
jgi:SOCS box./SH2 domain.